MGIQARKVITKEGLDWRVLERTSRGDILQHVSNVLLKTMCLVCCKTFCGKSVSRLNGEKRLYI